MKTFATAADLKATGWTLPVTDAEADEVVARASAYLSTLMARHGRTVDETDEVQAVNLRTVTCNIARRALSRGSVDGVSSFAQSIGSANVSVSYKDPDGSFFLTKSDRELLGISGRGGFRMLRPAIHAPDGSPVDGW